MVWKIVCALFIATTPVGVLHAGEPAKDRQALAAQRFASTCAACHKPNATVGQAPPLVNKALQHGEDRESLVRSIRGGYPSRGMPAFAGMLSDAEISDMASYLLAKRKANMSAIRRK